MEFAPAGRMSEGNLEGETTLQATGYHRSPNRWLCLCALLMAR